MRGVRYARRDELAKLSSLPRLAICGRRPAYQSPAITIQRTADGQARYGGAQSCGSVWSCPVCSARIRQQRAEELEAAAARWLRDGNGMVFATLTVRHFAAQPLSELLDVVARCWQTVQRQRRWRSASHALGYVGAVRAVEITHGRNGWHPHAHLLLCFDRPLSRLEAARLGEVLFQVWESAVSRAGGVAMRSGFDCQPVRAVGEVAKYVSKVQDDEGNERSLGSEMTRSDLKSRGGTVHPFLLLDRATNGDSRSAGLWREYERATKGRRCLTMGHKLRVALGLAQEDPDPEDETAPPAEVLYVFEQAALWRLVCSTGSRAELLTAAEHSGRDGVDKLLVRLVREAEIRWQWRNDKSDAPPGRAIRPDAPDGRDPRYAMGV